MKIYIGADHRGFEMKEELKKFLAEKGYEVEDVGAFKYDQTDDYPDFARRVAERVAGDHEHSRGVLITTIRFIKKDRKNKNENLYRGGPSRV